MNSNFPLDLSMDGFGVDKPQSAAPRASGADIAAEPSRPAPKSRPSGGQPRRKPTPSQRPTAPKAAAEPAFNKFIEFFRSQRTRLALGIILTIMCAVWLIVSINYLKQGPVDMSLAAGQSIEQMASAPEGVQNAGGAVGAKLAHVLMVEGLGVGAFVIVVYCGVLALSLFGLMRCRFWSFTFKCLFTAISLSIIFGLFTYNAETTFSWGGNHGHYVNKWLYHVSDAVGAYSVSIMLLGLLAVIYLTQIVSFYNNVSGKIEKARQAMAEAHARGRETSTEMNDIPEDKPQGPTRPAASPLSADAEKPATEGSDGPIAIDIKENEAMATVGNQASKTDNQEDSKANEAVTIGFSIDDDEEPVATNVTPASPIVLDPKPGESASGEPSFEIRSNIGGEASLTNDPAAFVPEDPTLQEPYNIRDELSRYTFPTPDLLIDRPMTATINPEEQQKNKDMIVSTLNDYGIPIRSVVATVGPTVTLYEIVPDQGVRIAQIKRLEDDIALSLAALGIRIIAPIPGRGTIGIEVPNKNPQTVSMFSVINSKEFRECKMALPMALGTTIDNKIFIEDLAKMPHLLVAGATGMGKSVGLNCILASLLYKKHPGELKIVLIDPKRVEFSPYAKLEHHFLAKLPEEDKPIVVEPSKALVTLQSLCTEMDLRYDLLESATVRTVEEYNRKFAQHRLNPEKGHRYLPYIVVVVDEFADLIMTAGKDISIHIARIAQKARAVGMHMIIATQRPSTDIITGMIKANFPGRIAFRVAQMVDSKTILDRPGANRLIGRGDMLFSHNSKMERVQCAFIDTSEVEALVDFIGDQLGYPEAYPLPEPVIEGGGAAVPGAIDLSKRDELFDDCARFVVQNSTASTSSLQRRFGIGYNKAGKIMDQLEAAGVVGPADGQKPRAVLVDSIMLEDILRGL